MAETFESFFTALLFGGGSLLGLLIFSLFLVAILLVWKFGYLIAIPISILVGILYIQHDLVYHGAIMLVFTAFSLYTATKEMR